ncbi:MAG: hypothetical protein HOK23_04390, partial [Euryarchaeota archaeon]|nr:hypothetical protein [Euryarchaeota archaeon]
MRIIAPMMILIMMTSTLAGCTGGDPDGGGNDNIDMDVLNQLIDDNLQDFINNTTITVNNHYHNNTSIVNNDNSQTNVTGSSSSLGNGSTNGIVRTIDYIFDLDYLWGNAPVIPGDRTNTYTTIWTYYDYPTNSERTDIFTFNCDVYYLVGSANSSNEQTYWENNNYYDDAWSDNGYNNTLRDIFHNIANEEDLRFTCDEDFYGYSSNSNYYSEMVYEFTIPEGFALMCLRGDYSNPQIYRSTNSTSNSINYEWSNYGGTQMIIDGLYWYCNNDMPSIGGEHDMIVQFGSSNLEENYNYRLIWSYQLVPV